MPEPNIPNRGIPPQPDRSGNPLLRNPNRLQPVYLFDPSAPRYNPTELVGLIKDRGVNPLTFIRSKIMQGVRVLAIGEEHGYFTMEQTLVDVVKDITEHSAIKVGTIALEASENGQWLFDKYLSGEDNVDDERMPLVFGRAVGSSRTETILEVVKYAKAHGIKIRCIDPRVGFAHYDQAFVDNTMHARVAEIAENDPDSVTLFYAGHGHITNYLSDEDRQLGYRHVSDYFPPEKCITIGQAHIIRGLHPDYEPHKTLRQALSQLVFRRRRTSEPEIQELQTANARLLNIEEFADDERLKHTGIEPDSVMYARSVYDQVLGNYSAVVYI